MTSNSRPTIAEVARAAKVAPSTVSRVLNGGYASADVKARVEKVTKRLGYIPSPTARNLKMGRAGIIGLTVESSQGAWFTSILQGVEEELSARRQSVAICSLAPQGKYDATAVESWLRERRVDGMIFARAGRRERPLIDLAVEMSLPVVFVGPDLSFREGFVVRSENRKAGAEVAAHLLGLGHRQVAFLGGPKASMDTRQRLQGLQEGLAEAQITVQAEHIHYAKDYRAESGLAFAESWLALPKRGRPTAVVFGNDEMALGFLRGVQASGISVPHEVSVVGFDGIKEAELWWPALTTVQQPMRKMGSIACQQLYADIDGSAASLESSGGSPPSSLAVPMELIVRESTGRAPA